MDIASPRNSGIAIRQRRKALGLTQVQLAKQAHVSERTLISIELGDAHGAQVDKILALLSALGLKMTIEEGCNGGLHEPRGSFDPCDASGQDVRDSSYDYAYLSLPERFGAGISEADIEAWRHANA